MTVAWLRVMLQNITSPHHHINPILLLMSGKLNGLESSQPHICQKVCSSMRSSWIKRFSPLLYSLTSSFYSLLITYYMMYHFPFYFNALQIAQQRSKQKLAVLLVHLVCCQQLIGQFLNGNKVYPLPSSSSSLVFFFFLFLSSLSWSPHSSCSRAGHAIRQHPRWPLTLRSHSRRATPSTQWIACTAKEFDPTFQFKDI